MISMVRKRLTPTKAASGAPGSSSTERKARTPSTSSLLGCTGQISPPKPILRHCLTTAVAWLPPNTAIERGLSRRSRRFTNDPQRQKSCSSPHRPQKRARDDVALDLAGAFPDAFHPRVAPDALERQIVHEPHAAMYLDRL